MGYKKPSSKFDIWGMLDVSLKEITWNDNSYSVILPYSWDYEMDIIRNPRLDNVWKKWVWFLDNWSFCWKERQLIDKANGFQFCKCRD